MTATRGGFVQQQHPRPHHVNVNMLRGPNRIDTSLDAISVQINGSPSPRPPLGDSHKPQGGQ